MSLELTEISVEGYEKVLHCTDSEAGLRGYISVHNTTLGPALGGMRMWPYTTDGEALEDANQLAKAMTYKAAVAETRQGGGKAVIIGDPADKTEGILLAMGRAIESLDGQYITAEDMNISVADLQVVGRETRWVSGLPVEQGSSGNPSPFTAYGCLSGMKACADEVYGTPELKGLRIAVHGVGAVGKILAELCTDLRAEVIVSDVDTGRARDVADKHGCTFVEDPEELLVCDCDILAPCARGSVLNGETIPRLQCRIVAGAANNQLGDPHDAQILSDRGVLYAPDYVINAGGIINIACEFAPGGYDEGDARRRAERIGDTLRSLFQTAREEGITPAEAAERLAESRLAEARTARGAS